MKTGIVIVCFFVHAALCVEDGTVVSNSRNNSTTEDIIRPSLKDLVPETTVELFPSFTEHSDVSLEQTSENKETVVPSLNDSPKSTILPQNFLSQSNTRDPMHVSVTTSYGDKDIQRELLQTPPQNSFKGLSSTCSAEPSQRVCGCTAICTELDNCCYDSEFIHFANNSYNKHSAYSCYESLGGKWVLSSPSRLVDKCLPSWEDQLIQQLCEAPNAEDFDGKIPCYSEESGFVFKNIYCLRCNLFQKCLRWELSFHSQRPISFSFIDTYEKLILFAEKARKVEFVLSGPDHQAPMHCTPSVIKTCVKRFASEDLTNLCHAYYSPIVVDGVFYRNIHCFKCNTGETPDGIGIAFIRGGNSALSILLNMQDGDQSKANNCDGTRCKPSILRIRGYVQDFMVYFRFKTNGSEQWMHEKATTHIKKTIGNMLVGTLHNALRGLDAWSSLDSYDIEPQFGIRTSFLILSELPVEEIPNIQRALLSMAFDFNMANGYSISCCFDENGESLSHHLDDRSSPRYPNASINAAEQLHSQGFAVNAGLSCFFVLFWTILRT